MAVGEENKKKKALAKRKRVAYGQKNNKLLLEIKKYIEQKIMYDNAKENAFNRLYQEMNRYKLMDAELDRHIEPLLLRFNAQTQRAIKVDFTDKKEEDYLVEAEKRKGFLWKGKVFRPEEVIIKRYRKAK
ncbi:MAG: hypothetical protein DDT31_00742 [Syntrophomonadaceae bacterium]|nr:hypothetical protein [Bacillota bacterium]